MTDDEKYEVKAEAFRRMTGMMAPGKSEPAAGHHDDPRRRFDAWEAWNNEYGPCVNCILAAIEAVRPLSMESTSP